MKFTNVAVLLGGTSAEREISLASGAAVTAALTRLKIPHHAIDMSSERVGDLMSGGYSQAFIILHGRGGEDGAVQGLLQWLDIPYTGSGVMGSAIAMDKLKTKQLWAGVGLVSAPFNMLDDNTNFARVIEEAGGKVMVKPICEGSSVGMSAATNASELAASYALARKYDKEIMAEQWLGGDEYTVAILDGKALPAIRIETTSEFYDFNAKYKTDSTAYHIPCGLSQVEEQTMQQTALEAFAALGCYGWGRVDFKADEHGKLYLLEVNTVPGMTNHSLVPKAAQDAGIEFDDLVLQILKSAC